jgi:hypothetical protein
MCLTNHQKNSLIILLRNADMAVSNIRENRQSDYDQGLCNTGESWVAEGLDVAIIEVRREFGLNQPK